MYLSKFFERCANSPDGLCDRFNPKLFASLEEAKAYMQNQHIYSDLCIIPAKCATDEEVIKRLERMGVRHIETPYYVGDIVRDSKGNVIHKGDKLYVKGFKGDKLSGTVHAIFREYKVYFSEESYDVKLHPIPCEINFISRTVVILEIYNPLFLSIGMERLTRPLEIGDLQKYYYKK